MAEQPSKRPPGALNSCVQVGLGAAISTRQARIVSVLCLKKSVLFQTPCTTSRKKGVTVSTGNLMQCFSTFSAAETEGPMLPAVADSPAAAASETHPPRLPRCGGLWRCCGRGAPQNSVLHPDFLGAPVFYLVIFRAVRRPLTTLPSGRIPGGGAAHQQRLRKEARRGRLLGARAPPWSGGPA